jgi:hypothetical protein
VTFLPLIVTTGFESNPNGEPPGPNDRVHALTFEVLTCSAESPTTSASNRARSQC